MKEIEYVLSIGEPWDFEGPGGRNIIRGTILSIKSNQCLVFKSNQCLRFNNNKGCILILTPRYTDADFSNLKDKNVTFNGSLLLEEYKDQLIVNELLDNNKFVVIGSIKRII